MSSNADSSTKPDTNHHWVHWVCVEEDYPLGSEKILLLAWGCLWLNVADWMWF